MQAEQLAKLGLGIAVVAAIIAGIATVGGPAQGRMEKRDMARMQDLRDLQSYVTCVARARDKTLPDSLDGNPECPRDLTTEDPWDGTPYTYPKLDAISYELCAKFELPEELPSWQAQQLNKETGCVRYQYHN